MADRDLDGVYDNADVCPSVASGAHADPEREGCPDADTDGDGVFDHHDPCPAEPPGRAPDPLREGCPAPDRDHDGYVDPVDHCPEQPEDFDGIDDDDGCPDSDPTGQELRVEIGPNRTISVSQPITFLSNSDSIVGAMSFRVLSALRSILLAHPEIQGVEVQGHTDGLGLASENLDLSLRRATVVSEWLVQHGVLSERVRARAMGATLPLRPNTTNENRAINRRVEFHIISSTL